MTTSQTGNQYSPSLGQLVRSLRVSWCANVAGSQLPVMIHLTRDLCGGQLCLMPSAASFRSPATAPWLEKYLRVGPVEAEERRKLFAFARDLLNSDHAGHRLTFQLFAQSPPFAHLLAVYNNYDFDGPLDLVRRYAGLADA